MATSVCSVYLLLVPYGCDVTGKVRVHTGTMLLLQYLVGAHDVMGNRLGPKLGLD